MSDNHEPLVVVEITGLLSVGREYWEGVSYWLNPESSVGLDNFAFQLQGSLLASTAGFFDVNKPFRLKLEVQRHTLRGLLARKMRHHLNHVGGGKKPAWEWTPCGATVFGVREAPKNG